MEMRESTEGEWCRDLLSQGRIWEGLFPKDPHMQKMMVEMPF